MVGKEVWADSSHDVKGQGELLLGFRPDDLFETKKSPPEKGFVDEGLGETGVELNGSDGSEVFLERRVGSDGRDVSEVADEEIEVVFALRG